MLYIRTLGYLITVLSHLPLRLQVEFLIHEYSISALICALNLFLKFIRLKIRAKIVDHHIWIMAGLLNLERALRL